MQQKSNHGRLEASGGLYALVVLLAGAIGAANHAWAGGGAGAAKNEAIKKDHKKYAGTWRVVSLEVDGNKSADSDAEKITVTNHADGTWILKVDGKEISKGTSKIDPTQKPKTRDLVPTEGAGKGETWLAIYEIEGDTRKLCFAPAGKERPTEFSAMAGSGNTLVVFQRQKP